MKDSQFFIFNNYTSSPSPSTPQNWSEKNLLVRGVVINIKWNKLAQAVPVEICEPFPNIKILFLEGGRGAIWQSTIDKVQSIICVFFWRKNATENFQSFCFLRVESRILMTVSTFYVEEFQILVILSFKLKTSQINGNKTLTDIQNF